MAEPFTAQRRSAIEKIALKAGAKLVERNGWRQVESFTSPESEMRAVREGAGISDLSPLTKIDLRARDSSAAWGMVFPGEEGPAGDRIRSAPLCGQPVLAARLNPGRIFFTAPPGWGQTMETAVRKGASEAKVGVTDVTSGFSVIELAGPAAASVLRKLTPVEPPGEDQTLTEAQLGHVHAIIFRVDGLPEVGSEAIPAYRLHVQRDLGFYLWEVLEDAGREFALAPYGTEARSRLFPKVFSA